MIKDAHTTSYKEWKKYITDKGGACLTEVDGLEDIEHFMIMPNALINGKAYNATSVTFEDYCHMEDALSSFACIYSITKERGKYVIRGVTEDVFYAKESFTWGDLKKLLNSMPEEALVKGVMTCDSGGSDIYPSKMCFRKSTQEYYLDEE